MDYLQIRTIDGETYGVRAFPAKTGMLTGIKLGKLLGPFLAALPGMAKESTNSPEFSKALESLFERMEDDDVVALVDKLLSYTEREGKPLGATWNVDYAGKLGTLFKIIKFAVEAQFGSFLQGFAKTAEAEPKAAQASRSGK